MMAGIDTAKAMIDNGQVIGIVRAVTTFISDDSCFDDNLTKVYIMDTYQEDGTFMGREAISDYGSDIRVGNCVGVGTVTKLTVLDDYTAGWVYVLNPENTYDWL